MYCRNDTGEKMMHAGYVLISDIYILYLLTQLDKIFRKKAKIWVVSNYDNVKPKSSLYKILRINV